MSRKGQVYVGTSGWEYPHWEGPFYPKEEKNHLAYYSDRFGTVELNNSFYRLPRPEHFKRWADAVPEDFIFAVKASRYITHRKYLKNPQETTEKLFENMQSLGGKLGPVLFQLPPNWHANPGRLAGFLSALPGDFRYTFEFRHGDWFREEVYDLLKAYNVAFCIYEIKARQSPWLVTADFVYIRMHGPEKSAYTGQYSDGRLDELAGRIRGWADEGLDVYCYFDNDQMGYAVEDARRLLGRIPAGLSVKGRELAIAR